MGPAEIEVVPGFERTSFAVITASVSRVDFAPVYPEKFDLDSVADWGTVAVVEFTASLASTVASVKAVQNFLKVLDFQHWPLDPLQLDSHLRSLPYWS